MDECASNGKRFGTEHDTIEQKEGKLNWYFTNKPKSKICFSIIVHENRELVKELINNVRHFCPNSTMVLFNGGEDPDLCENLGVPVCPSSRKLNYGYTTIYFLETMEWIEKLGIQYEYFINIDSDALFIKNGFEEIINNEMKNTDYMAVRLRIPEPYWHGGTQLKRDIARWRELFCLEPFYGVFNVGQVINRSLVKALLDPKKKEKYKKTLTETISFGSDEIFFVNMAHELGLKMKNYPYESDAIINRYRPYFHLGEILDCLNNRQFCGLCHPVYRDKNDQTRILIKHLTYKTAVQPYRNKDYPWHEMNDENYAPSLPFSNHSGNEELIVRKGKMLIHYLQDNISKKWTETPVIAKNAAGTPVCTVNSSGQFELVCKLEQGGIGYWWRDQNVNEQLWHGPSLITQEDAEPIMLGRLNDGRTILVCKSLEKLYYWVGSKDSKWMKGAPLP